MWSRPANALRLIGISLLLGPKALPDHCVLCASVPGTLQGGSKGNTLGPKFRNIGCNPILPASAGENITNEKGISDLRKHILKSRLYDILRWPGSALLLVVYFVHYRKVRVIIPMFEN